MRSSRAKAKGTFAFPLLHTGLLRPNRSQWNLINTHASGELAWEKKCFDQVVFATKDHSRKSFVRLAFRDIRFRVMPQGQQFKPREGNFTVLNAIEEVPEHRGRKIVSGNPGHGS